MLLHDLRLALRSLRRNPYLSGLMILTIAVGIAASIVAITLYHARAGHPIPWKEDKLFAVELDTRDNDPDQGFSKHPEYPPYDVTWRDAQALYRSDIPKRAVMMFRSQRLLIPERKADKPFNVSLRVTTADFFPMFDTPFQYGGGWTRAADDAPEPVVVLSKYINDKVFGGANSVGREITLQDRRFKVVGVLTAWMPQPRFYDMTNGAFDLPEDVYMPFGWFEPLKLHPAGVSCVSKRAQAGGLESLKTQDCVWLQYWIEVSRLADRDRFQRFVDNYTRDQQAHGRMPRPPNNWIVNVSTVLRMFDVVGDDSRTQVALAVMFLVVCILNTLGLMLAKFLSGAPVSGLRRALGASRQDIVRQHLVEVVVVGLLGGAAGLLLSVAGLTALRIVLFSAGLRANDNPARIQLAQSMVHLDFSMLAVAVALSLLTGILAGLYPAWRIGRLAPATFLKTQ